MRSTRDTEGISGGIRVFLKPGPCRSAESAHFSRLSAQTGPDAIPLARHPAPHQNARVAMKNLNLIAKLSVLSLVVSVGACTPSKSTTEAPAGSGSAAVTSSGAKIELAEVEHDFGTVTEGETVKHTFIVKNTGTTPLLISRVRSSCGCTAAVTKDKEVPPGGQTEIEVSFNTTGRMGPNRKTITIQSNDDKNPNAKIEIKAMIERLLAFQPSIVRLNVKHGEEQKIEAWLTGKLMDDAKLVVGQIEGDDDVKVEVAEKKEGDKTIKGIRVSLKGSKVGRTNGTIKIATGVEKVPELVLRFNANVMGNVELRPRALYFDNRNPKGKERVMRVTSTREGFKLTSAKILEGPYKATIEKPETGAGYEVHVTLEAKEDQKDNLNGKLQLVSNDPLEPKIEVPLNVRQLPNLVRPRPPLPMGRPGGGLPGKGAPPTRAPAPVAPPPVQ